MQPAMLVCYNISMSSVNDTNNNYSVIIFNYNIYVNSVTYLKSVYLCIEEEE